MVACEKSIPRLACFALASLAFYLLCLHATVPVPAPDTETQRRAVSLALEAQRVLGPRLMGPEYTEITTTLAPAEAKKLSLCPDFAALAVQLLREAGVRKGSRVAVNVSGSFPALNVAALAAIEALGAAPVIVSSVGASTRGATDPGDTWLDMERSLVDGGIWSLRSAAASIGGVGDRGGGLSPEGVALAREAIKRTAVPAIEAASLEEAIALRMKIFRGESGELPAVLINVGGNHVFFGAQGHRAPLKEGLTHGDGHAAPPGGNGIGALFLRAGRPVVNLLNVKRLAERYDIRREAPTCSSDLFRVKVLPKWVQWAAIGWIAGAIFLMAYGYRKRWWRGPVR